MSAENAGDFFERELASFVPDRLFDAHAHLWHTDFCPVASPAGLPATVGLNDYRAAMADLFPGRYVGGWFLPKPFLREGVLPAQVGAWQAESLRGQQDCPGAYLVRPGDDAEQVRETARRLGLRGFKCYHSFAAKNPTWEADIPDYLPEALVRVADEEGWAITLHLVKARAVADPANLHWIRHYCQRYPRMTLILAHSARGFQPAHNLEGLPKLADLPNLYFDASANCEPVAHEAILRICGADRLLAGTDFGLASHDRGRSVAVADTFLWLTAETPVWDAKHTRIHPVPIVYEHFRSLKWACWSARLTDRQIEDVFWNNAARVFGFAR